MTSATSTPATVQLLGCFGFVAGGRPTRLPYQAQRLVAYLAISERGVVRREAAERLWPFTGERRAHGNLRTAIWRVRKAAPEAMVSDRNTIQLAQRVSIDYRDLLWLGCRLPSPPAALSQASLIERLRHDLLPGWDEEWLMIERERARQLRMRRLEELSREFVTAHEFGDAVEAAFASIEIEPLRETAHLALIEAHVAEGNRGEAFRQALRLRTLLAKELGLQPSADFQTRLGELGLAATGIE